MPESTVSDRSTSSQSLAAAYWRANLKLVTSLLVVWFVVSFGLGIIAVDALNEIPFFGFKLGFWWAQQGAIYVFVILVFVYAGLMRGIDRKYGVDEHSAADNASNKRHSTDKAPE